jgi:PEP-CTERM motif-containing protein
MKMTRPLKIATAVLIAGLAGPVSAAVSLDLIPIDNSEQLTGYRTFDLQLNTPISDWTGSALLLELSAGSIYQASLGGDGPIPSEFFGLVPELEFDTYVGVPGSSIAGGAGDVKGGDTFEFSTERLSATFFNTANTDIGRISIGRVTLSDDAVGSWSLISTTVDRRNFTHTGSIGEGVFKIDTETIRVPTTSAVSLVSQADGTTLITINVTDSIRAQAGISGIPGESDYEAAVGTILTNLLLEEIDKPGSSISLSSDTSFRRHNEPYTYTEAEYLKSIAPPSDANLPEPGTVALLGIGGLALLRRR